MNSSPYSSLSPSPMSKLPAGLSPVYWSTWHQRSSSVSESLDAGETWIGGWSNVGLYERDNKVPEYQTLSVHITTHRLILVPDQSGPSTSTANKTPNLQVNLRYVRQTEFYNGFMRSSSKITLSLGPSPQAPILDEGASVETSWTCGVCGYVNGIQGGGMNGTNGTNGMNGAKCGLCGVAFATGKAISTPVTRTGSPAPVSLGGRSQDERISTMISTISTPPAQPESRTTTEIACPACTFLNHPSLTSCEICSTTLPRRQPSRPERQASAPPEPSAAGSITPGGEVRLDVARLSFRKGGSSEAYRRLKNVLSDKAWERAATVRDRTATPTVNGQEAPRPSAGIDGILQAMSLDAKYQDDHMKDAFKDLEVLMVRAGEMVKLAQSLNSKLTASGSVSNEEATLIRSSLVQLGLPAPAVTQDMVRDEQRYNESLARELGQLLTGSGGRSVNGNAGTAEAGRAGLMVGEGGRGVIALDEVWGLWMRARGVALLPPSTLMAILPVLSTHTSPPINLLVLPSTLNVLHTPAFAPPAILSRLISRLTPNVNGVHSDIESDLVEAGESDESERSLSLLEISSQEGLPIGLTKELMESIERISAPERVREPVGVVRDDQAVGDGGVRWYRDIISGWEL